MWLDGPLPYHGRLALESALVAMPAAEVHLHLVGTTTRPVVGHADVHVAEVARRERVVVHRHAPDALLAATPDPGAVLELWHRIPAGAASARSNLARLAILLARGGVYLDTDVLVLRPLADPDEVGCYVGAERVWALNRTRVTSGLGPIDLVRAIPWAVGTALARLDARLLGGTARLAELPLPASVHRLQVNNAVIGAPAGAPFVRRALERALAVDPRVRFALGPTLLDDLRRDEPALVDVVPPVRFYVVPPGRSYRWFEDRRLRVPVEAEVMHYVASNHRRLLRTLTVDDPRFEQGRAPFWTEARRVRHRLARLAIDHGVGDAPAAPRSAV